MAEDLICRIVNSIAPSAQVFYVLNILQSVPQRSQMPDGRLCPVVVFGLPDEKSLLLSMPGYPGEAEAAEEGVFYLSLPSGSGELSELVRKVAVYGQKDLSASKTRERSVSLIRALKHDCENLKSAWAGGVNIAAGKIVNDPACALRHLDIFHESRIGILCRGNAAIRFWVGDGHRYGLGETDERLVELKALLNEIQHLRRTQLSKAIDLTNKCASLVQGMVSDLMSAIRRLRDEEEGSNNR